MDTVEVRRRFTAYGAGEIPADELRLTIRNSLGQNPLLASAYVALAEAYRRANVIDAGLQSVINSDIAEVTGPRFARTRIRPPGPGANLPPSHTQLRTGFDPNSATVFRRNAPGQVESTGWQQPPAADAGADNSYAPRSAPTGFQSMPDPVAGLTGVQTTGRTTSGTNGSAWDSVERLTEVAEPLFPGSVLRERFELTEELGRGGMGVVFKAYDRTRAELRDPFVAIKVLNEDFKRHPLAVRALQREARKAQKLAHPNIVTVYDFDRDRGNVYMVMEYLSGRSLDQVINGEARSGMSVKRALDIVRALAAALTYAHEQDIVHSDLKPSNAFITEDNRIKVLDFGIARAAPSQMERGEKTIFDAGQLGAISPAYASLEMLQGAEPDPRDDIYALACVTYELLTGHHPFNRIDAAKAAAQRLQPAPVRGLSRAQWHGLRRGLTFERSARTPTAAEFVQNLTQKSRRPLMWKSLAASILLIGLAAAGAQFAFWQYHTVQQRILAADSNNFPQLLADLHRYPQLFLDWVLADDATSTALTERFRAQTAQDIDTGDYAQATTLLRELRTLMPTTPAATELTRRLEQQKAQQVKELLAERDAALGKALMVPSQGEANVTDLTLRISRLDPTNRALLDPAVARAYARGASTATEGNQQELTREILTSGLNLFPDDEDLRALQARLSGTAAPGSPPENPDAGQLAELLQHPEAATAWQSAVTAQLSRLPGTDPRISQAKTIGAHTFAQAAAEARKRKDYNQATDFLATAQSFDAQSSEVTAETEALNRERTKGDSRVARSPDQSLKNQIAAETLKDKLIEQAFAGDIVGANTSAEQLAKAMPGSVFVAHDIPDILSRAYQNLARRQFAEGHVDAALTTLQAGRRKVPRSEDLEVLQQRYTSAGEFYDTLAGAVTLNVTQKKLALQQLRTTQGEDYAAAEKMFAQTLANRIADQRAANRPSVANSLLASGRELFPDYAAQLSQGTPGILVGDTPTDTAASPAARAADAGAPAPGSSAPKAPGDDAAPRLGSASPAGSAPAPGSPTEKGAGAMRTASSEGESSAAPAANRLPAAPAELTPAPARTETNTAPEAATKSAPGASEAATPPSAQPRNTAQSPATAPPSTAEIQPAEPPLQH